MRETWELIPVTNSYKIPAWHSVVLSLIGITAKQYSLATSRNAKKPKIHIVNDEA